MMRVPGRKETGVIFTTGTELPVNERLERNERERPSGSGLLRSKDETAGSNREKASRGPEEGDMKRKDDKEWRYHKTLNNSTEMKSKYEL